MKGNKGFFVKILGNGSLTKKLTVNADAFSQSAIKAIENAGGKAILIKESRKWWYNCITSRTFFLFRVKKEACIHFWNVCSI